MRPSNPPASVALFQNCESVAIAPQLLEEIRDLRVAIAVRNASGRRRWSKLAEWLPPCSPGSRRIGVAGPGLAASGFLPDPAAAETPLEGAGRKTSNPSSPQT